MWLLNTKTLRLQWFIGEEIPKYAILSHRWENQEVSFANMRDCRLIDDNLADLIQDEWKRFRELANFTRFQIERLQLMKGWVKIQNFCEASRAHGCRWAWIDTVCIDKSSSAELQEAINSMFNWYARAKRCIVYMCDVKSGRGDLKHEFRSSAWFKRGWTLQELLAPAHEPLTFYDRNWRFLGRDLDFIEDIEFVTTIPRKILITRNSSRREGLEECCFAQRFSWAASRQVTRQEDETYCLLGLFDVNMPLLYGEGGPKAFFRLLSELLKTSLDETIFAWNFTNTGEFLEKHYREAPYGLLPKTPREFSGLGNLRRFASFKNLRKGRGGVPQLVPTGIRMNAIVLDKKDENLPSNLRHAKGWEYGFAVPLHASSEVKYKSGVCLETVFLQLNHWFDDEFLRLGVNFTADFDWDEAQARFEPREFVIRSDKSLLRAFPF